MNVLSRFLGKRKNSSTDLESNSNIRLKQLWVLTCAGCSRNFILGVNATAACWEEVYTLGRGSLNPEDVIGKLQSNGGGNDLIGDTEHYQPIPHNLNDGHFMSHKYSSRLLRKALESGQKRKWDCNHCKQKDNAYPQIPKSFA